MSTNRPSSIIYRQSSSAFCRAIPSTPVENVRQINLFMQNKPNFPHFSPEKEDFAKKQTQFKPNSNPIKANFRLISGLAKPKQTQFLTLDVSSLALEFTLGCAYLFFCRGSGVKPNNQSSLIDNHLEGKANFERNTFAISYLQIGRIMPLYKLFGGRYYNRHKRRCSSTVEHSFRKAGVEGSNPSIGCSGYTRVHILRESHYGKSN
jgi:hypothetical protein